MHRWSYLVGLLLVGACHTTAQPTTPTSQELKAKETAAAKLVCNTGFELDCDTREERIECSCEDKNGMPDLSKLTYIILEKDGTYRSTASLYGMTPITNTTTVEPAHKDNVAKVQAEALAYLGAGFYVETVEVEEGVKGTFYKLRCYHNFTFAELRYDGQFKLIGEERKTVQED